MSRTLRKFLAVIIVLGLIFTAFGCSKEEATAEPETNPSVDTNETGESTDPTAATNGLKVRYVCLTKGIPYFDPIIAGMKAEVEAAGGVFQDTAPDQSDATAQIPLIEAAIQDKVDVIYLSPSAPDTLNAVLDDARAQGIKVLCVNDDILGNEGHRDGAVMACNYDDLAVDSFKAFGEAMNYEGSFVVISSKPDTPFQNNQIEFYQQMIANDERFAKMELVEVLYGNDEAGKSLTESEAAIQKYPDLKGIMAPTTVAVIAAAQAVENAGLGEDIVVFGLGTPNQSKNFLDSGVLDGAFLWDTYRTGAVAGKLAVALVDGSFELVEGATFNAGDYGEITVLANNVLYAGPPVKFTAENAADYNF